MVSTVFSHPFVLMLPPAKWLGAGAITPLAVDGKGGKAELLEKVARWVAARGRNVTQPVMIVSYETLRTLTAYLNGCKIGLLLCDEGHRLKNSGILNSNVACLCD